MRAPASLLLISTAVLAVPGGRSVDARPDSARPGTYGVRRQAAPPVRAPRAPQVPSQILTLQVLLDRAGFSPGEIDGSAGPNLARALSAFQRERGLVETGRPDAAVLQALGAADGADALVDYTTTEADLAGPFTPEIPSDLIEQGSLPALGYTSLLEMLGERFHASPTLIERLNPGATFASPGEVIRVPNVPPWPTLERSGTNGQPAGTNGTGDGVVTVSKRSRALRVSGPDGRLLFVAPVTVGSEHDPLPIGEWAVTGLWPDPIFHYNPELFWDADPSHSKAKLQPGPNNPVGVMWIDLTREHYGLHGTPEPSRVGHTASHGCVRLTNWDVMRVATLVKKGTRVVFEE